MKLISVYVVNSTGVGQLPDAGDLGGVPGRGLATVHVAVVPCAAGRLLLAYLR